MVLVVKQHLLDVLNNRNYYSQEAKRDISDWIRSTDDFLLEDIVRGKDGNYADVFDAILETLTAPVANNPPPRPSQQIINQQQPRENNNPPAEEKLIEVKGDQQCDVCFDKLEQHACVVLNAQRNQNGLFVKRADGNCGHVFHQSCMEQIMKNSYSNNKKCPMCKEAIEAHDAYQPV